MTASGDIGDVRIRTLASGGDALGHLVDGSPGTWFVPEALPGELVRVRAIRVARKHIVGEIERVLEPSALRRPPPCALAGTCGGCGWQHVDPSAQGELKLGIVADALRGLAPAPHLVASPGSSVSGLDYRRRARMHYTRRGDVFELGFHRKRSNAIVDVPSCPVLVPALRHAFARLRAAASHLPADGEVVGLAEGEHAVLGLPGVRPSRELLAALEGCLDRTLVGIDVRGGRRQACVGDARLVVDKSGGLPGIELSPFAFAQAQAPANLALVRYVVGRAKPDGARILELFSGAGNFTRALARTAQRVYAVDDDREAIGALRRLAEATGLPINAKHGDVARLVPKIAAGPTRYELVVADPPKGGLGKEVARALAVVATHRIVIVACDVATLARDLGVLREHGFAVADVAVLDLMPMTAEVEVVATLVREGAR